MNKITPVIQRTAEDRNITHSCFKASLYLHPVADR
jgi:hypothetical protein